MQQSLEDTLLESSLGAKRFFISWYDIIKLPLESFCGKDAPAKASYANSEDDCRLEGAGGGGRFRDKPTPPHCNEHVLSRVHPTMAFQ